MIDRLRYEVGDDELTMTGLTAAIFDMMMRGHRAVKAGSKDSVSPLRYEVIAFGTNSFNVEDVVFFNFLWGSRVGRTDPRD